MALIPPHFLNAVVSIGIEKKNDSGEVYFSSIATGFLVGKALPQLERADEGKRYKLFLVTNKHVFQNKKGQFLKSVLFRLNTTEGKSHQFQVNLLNPDETPIWRMHTNEKVDLAILPINANSLTEAKIDFYFFKDQDLFFAKDFPTKNVSTGDGLFVLGFPMSISGKDKNFVIVRQGIIARVDEEVLEECFYYIDASAYPGNSGGPVIAKPEVVAIQGTRSNSQAALIGVISAGVTYREVAVSEQTGEAKIVFTEQTGLVKVVPIELVYEIIDMILTPVEPSPEAEVEEVSSEELSEEKVQEPH